MPFSPGNRLGPYEILALLGAGGMGEVYRVGEKVVLLERLIVGAGEIVGSITTTCGRVRTYD